MMRKSQQQPDHSTTTFTFDLPRMMAAIDSGVISFPQGMSRQERREWVKKALRDRAQA